MIKDCINYKVQAGCKVMWTLAEPLDPSYKVLKLYLRLNKFSVFFFVFIINKTFSTIYNA